MGTVFRGSVHKVGDYLDSDHDIIPFKQVRAWHSTASLEATIRTMEQILAEHCLVAVDPEFPKKVRPGDILVAGRNFGGVFSHDQAAVALKAVGLAVVVADSISRGFFRKLMQVGMPALPCPGITKLVETGHELEVDLATGTVRNLTTGEACLAPPLPDFLIDLLAVGGLTPYLKRQISVGRSAELAR